MTFLRTERLLLREWRDRSHFAERGFGLWAARWRGARLRAC